MRPLLVETVDTLPALEELGVAWDDLLANSDGASWFVTREWLFTWWKHLADRRRLRALIVRDDQRLLAVCPLTLRPAGWGRQPALPCLEWLGGGEAGSDYVDVIARRGWEQAAVAALGGHLASETHMFSLRRLRAPSLAGELAVTLARLGWTQVRRGDEASPFIDLRGMTFDAYLATIGSAHRYAYRRRHRWLAARHRLELRRVSQEHERAPALGALIALHQQRWRAHGVSEAFSRPALVAFHDEVSRVALARGCLRLYLLELDGEPVAGWYGFRYRDVLSFYQSGFAPALAERSVGLVLHGMVIEAACAEGVAELDLLHGEEAYKRHWARATRPLVRLDLFPPGPRGWLYRGTAALERRARRLGRRVIEAA